MGSACTLLVFRAIETQQLVETQQQWRAMETGAWSLSITLYLGWPCASGMRFFSVRQQQSDVTGGVS